MLDLDRNAPARLRQYPSFALLLLLLLRLLLLLLLQPPPFKWFVVSYQVYTRTYNTYTYTYQVFVFRPFLVAAGRFLKQILLVTDLYFSQSGCDWFTKSRVSFGQPFFGT